MNDSKTAAGPQPADDVLLPQDVLKLRDLAQAHGWQGERDELGLAEFFSRQLQATAITGTCTLAPSEQAAPVWGCYDCGFCGPGFRTLVQGHEQFEAECPSCGSRHTDEAAVVLRELVATLEGLREEQADEKPLPAEASVQTY